MPRSDILATGFPEQSGNDDSSLDNFTTDVVITNDVDDAVTESEPDAEEEIDQLDSDSDVPPEQPAPEVPAPKKPQSRSSGERRWGHALLPANRVENILQAEGLIGGSMNLSKEGVYLLSIATEEFIRQFSELGHGRAQYYNRNMIRYDDMAAVVGNRQDFNFLRDFIPTPRSLHSAFAARNKREKDLLKDDPAMQFQNGGERRSRSPSDSSSSSYAFKLEQAPCIPARERPTMKAAAPTPPRVPVETVPTANQQETWEEYKERSRRYFGIGDSSRLKHSKSPTNLSNGISSPHSVPPAQSSTEPHSDPHTTDPDDRIEVQHERDRTDLHFSRKTVQPHFNHLTGPGSAFLQGPSGPLPLPPPSFTPSNHRPATTGSSSSSSVPPQAQGRTIYSTGNDTQENVD